MWNPCLHVQLIKTRANTFYALIRRENYIKTRGEIITPLWKHYVITLIILYGRQQIFVGMHNYIKTRDEIFYAPMKTLLRREMHIYTKNIYIIVWCYELQKWNPYKLIIKKLENIRRKSKNFYR